MSTKKLQIQMPSQGWEQFLSGRSQMLQAFDNARTQAKAHKAETQHGRVLEAEVRKWLASFLPKRYGVTSGYVVSAGQPSEVRAPHFDVIVFDQLQSPVLWVEHSADSSDQGLSRAIPVEYVLAVLEVKSSITAGTTKEAITHLLELSPLLNGADPPDARYKLHLPPSFCCGLIFAEQRAKSGISELALSTLLSAGKIRGFLGGLILRSKDASSTKSGRITFLNWANADRKGPSARGTSRAGIEQSKWIQIEPNVYVSAAVLWMVPAFSMFAFDLLALLNGTFDPRRLSSFYGLGGPPGTFKQAR